MKKKTRRTSNEVLKSWIYQDEANHRALLNNIGHNINNIEHNMNSMEHRMSPTSKHSVLTQIMIKLDALIQKYE